MKRLNLPPEQKISVKINEEIANINRALERDEFELINRLGHGCKGAVTTYGL